MVDWLWIDCERQVSLEVRLMVDSCEDFIHLSGCERTSYTADVGTASPHDGAPGIGSALQLGPPDELRLEHTIMSGSDYAAKRNTPQLGHISAIILSDSQFI